MGRALGILIAGLALSTSTVGQSQQATQSPQAQEARGLDRYAFEDPSAPIESRIDSILSLMTLEEKVAILGRTIQVPRLGIKGTGIGEALSGVLLGTLYEPLIADAMSQPAGAHRQDEGGRRLLPDGRGGVRFRRVPAEDHAVHAVPGRRRDRTHLEPVARPPGGRRDRA
jgi:hypothetical protein